MLTKYKIKEDSLNPNWWLLPLVDEQQKELDNATYDYLSFDDIAFNNLSYLELLSKLEDNNEIGLVTIYSSIGRELRMSYEYHTYYSLIEKF